MTLQQTATGIALVFALAAHPAGAGDAQLDVRNTLVAYFAAVKTGDWGAMYDLMDENSRGGQSREEFKTAREGGMGAELGKAIQTRSTYEVGEVRLGEGGANATADVKIRMPDLRSSSGSMPSPQQIAQAPLQDLQRTMQLVVEGGAWKVVRPKAAMSPEAMERFQKAARESIERARKAEETPATGKAD